MNIYTLLIHRFITKELLYLLTIIKEKLSHDTYFSDKAVFDDHKLFFSTIISEAG